MIVTHIKCLACNGPEGTGRWDDGPHPCCWCGKPHLIGTITTDTPPTPCPHTTKITEEPTL